MVPIDSDLKRAYMDNKETVHAAIETAHHAIVQATIGYIPGTLQLHSIINIVNNQTKFKVPKHAKPISPNSYGIISNETSA